MGSPELNCKLSEGQTVLAAIFSWRIVCNGNPLLGFVFGKKQKAMGMAFRKSEPHRTSTNRSLLVDAIKGADHRRRNLVEAVPHRRSIKG